VVSDLIYRIAHDQHQCGDDFGRIIVQGGNTMTTTGVAQMPVPPLRHGDRFFIDGNWVAPSGSSMFDLVQPHTEEVYGQVPLASSADMDQAITAARRAFDDGPWPRLKPAERAEYLRKIASKLRERGAELAHRWTNETGVVHSFALAATANSGAPYDFFAGLADTFDFVERHDSPDGGYGLLIHEPVGVVGAIIPWNSSSGAVVYKAAPALLAGCTLIIKSSPEAPSAVLILAEVAEEVGLPTGVINCLTADREVSEMLVTDPRVDKIAFTGSTVAGRRIAALAGGRMARYTLELGGKSAAVILDDYDLNLAASSLAGSSTRMTGQTCASLTRIIISKHRHDEFVETLSGLLAAIRVGDPFAADTQMGPLAMARQRDRVEHYIAKGLEEGATLATGGKRPDGLDRGYYVRPTVFANVDNSSTIAQEEIFGPVLSVIPANDEQHAVQLANDTIFGLNNGVFTHDSDRALAVARQLRSGNVGHNSARYNFNVGFGGVKQSGVGREGGREGLLPYLEAKTIILDSAPTTI
jgi:aldehyde dehydrogenase (NAD+)